MPILKLLGDGNGGFLVYREGREEKREKKKRIVRRERELAVHSREVGPTFHVSFMLD